MAHRSRQQRERDALIRNIALTVIGLLVLGLGFWAFGVRPAQQKAAAMNAIADDVKNSRSNGTSDAAFIMDESYEAADPDVVAVVGDSYTGGNKYGGLKDKNWTAQADSALSDTDHHPVFDVSGKGGSGYVQAGTAGTRFTTEVETVVGPATDVVVFFGSRNDARASASDLRAAADEAYASIEDIAPDAKIIVVGPVLLEGDSAATFKAMRGTLSAAAEDAGAEFVDPTAEGWFEGTPASLIGEDGVHPTDEGHALIGKKIAPHIQDALGY